MTRRTIMKESLRLIKNSENSEIKEWVTTPAFYINGEPHLGHIYSIILASNLSKKQNKPLITGCDVHGRKMREFFEKEGYLNVSKGVLIQSQSFKNTFLEYSTAKEYRFLHTNEDNHIAYVKGIWSHLADKGLIKTDFYRGYYILNEERFTTKEEPNSIPYSSEEYFLNLTLVREKVLNKYRNKKIKLRPENLISKVEEFIHSIDTLCISRKERWGIAIPGSKNKTIHVWFDALLYYLSWRNVRPSDKIKLTQVIGKDILLFHSWYWPALLELIGVDYELDLYVTGWILAGNQKLSKSERNSSKIIKIESKDVLERFLLTRPLGKDFSIEKNEIRKAEKYLLNRSNLIERILPLGKICEWKFPSKRCWEKNYFILEEWLRTANRIIDRIQIWRTKRITVLKYLFALSVHIIINSDPIDSRLILYFVRMGRETRIFRGLGIRGGNL